MNPLLKTPSTDFNTVRDGRNSLPLYIDVDLSTARSINANTQLVLDIAGNSFYSDADTTNGGNAVIHFQDTNLGISAAPFFVSPGFIANVGFTKLLIENTAQAGKRIRIFYGVDIDFQAGVNSSISISGAVSVMSQVRKIFSQSNTTAGIASAQLLAAKADRDYLLIQNTHATATIYVRLDGASATVANGIKIGPGGSLELSNTVPVSAIFAISDTAATTVILAEA